MRKQIRKIIYFIIVLILAGSAYGILSNGGSKRINDSNITYLLNTRTKKVHSKDCGVGKRAKENAINNYHKYYSKIDVKGGILQYPCEFIENASYYNKAGDDCVKYVFTVLNSIDPQFVARISKTFEKPWSKINTKIFNGEDKDFFKTMTKNGFKIYDSNKTINDEYIKVINSK